LNQYSHHIPGRLRVRVGAAKRNAQNARALQMEIQGMHGVTSVEVNLLTGSILVRYDPDACDTRALLSFFDPWGHKDLSDYDKLRDRIGEKVAITVAGYLIEVAVERAALALISAVL
jgi:copper chaperone CopZ